MTKRNLLVISFVAGVLSFLIVAAANYLIRGGLSRNDTVTALVVGLSSGVGLYFVFLGTLGKKGC